MSTRAMEWAIATQGHRNSTQKGVLVQLGWCFEEKWGYAWVSHKKLAPACSLSERQLIRHLNALEEGGYIEVTRGSHHTATKYRLRVDLQPPQNPTAVERQPRTKNPKRRKVSVYQKPLESGSQDFSSGDVGDTPEESSGVTWATSQNLIRGDMGDTSEESSGVTSEVNSGVTSRVFRGDIQGKELCSNDAHQKEVKKGYVNPVPGIQELKKDEKENIEKGLLPLLPGGDVCPRPGETGRSSRGQQSSVFPGFTKKPITETEAEDIGPAPPNPFRVYEQNIGPLTPMLTEKIKDAEQRYGAASIHEAIGIALTQNKRTWAYVEGILRKWASEGKGATLVDRSQSGNRKRYLESARHRGRATILGSNNPEGYLEDYQAEQERRAPPEEADPEALRIWSAVLDSLRPGLDKPTFETWLAATCGVDFDEQRFVVEVPTPFAIAWLERRMYQNIQKTVQQVTGKLLDIQFQCSA